MRPTVPGIAPMLLAGAAICTFLLPPVARAQFVNDAANDPGNSCQSAPSLAQLDGVLVAAYLDFRTGDSNHIRCSWSADSGATWTPLGVPPVPFSAHWVTDARVVASPVHGRFFVFGACNDASIGAMYACVPLTISGGVAVWGTPRVVRGTWPGSVQTVTWGHDAAVSPTTGRLFAAATYLGGSAPELDLQYSDDQGVTWSVPFRQDSMVSSPRLRVHGNRVYLINANGTPSYLAVTAASGPSWWSVSRLPKRIEAMPTGYSPGAPPNVFTIDESNGVHDGRIHAAWTESYDFTDETFPDPLTQANPTSEIEPDDTFLQATPFSVGDVLRGSLATSGTDEDHFSIALAQAQHVILWVDSTGVPLTNLLLQVADSSGTRPLWQATALQRGGRVTFVAPRATTYDFRLTGTFSGGVARGYRVRTTAGFVGAEPATDQCDVLTAWSDDDGATWSAPVRANVSAVGTFDDGPTIEVDAHGRPLVGWWTRTPGGGTSDARWRLLRSNDAGATWVAGPRLTTTPTGTDWSQLGCSASGIGSILALPDRNVYAFTELEPGTTVQTDIRAAVEPTTLEFVACGPDMDGQAGHSVYPSATVRNDDPYFAEPILWSASSDRGWPIVQAPTSAPAGATSFVMFPYPLPDTAATGTVNLQYVASRFGAGLSACYAKILVHGVTDVGGPGGATFGIAGVWPNPARDAVRLRFRLPRPAWVTLDVLGADGRRVARLANELCAPGEHERRWDVSRPGAAHLPPGVYVLDLRAGGERDTRRLVLVR